MKNDFHQTMLLIKQLNDKFEAKGTAACSKFGLTLSQFRFLGYLKMHQETQVTQREMEKFFKVSHPAVNGVLKRLEEKGFVSTELINEGKTQKIVHLEQKGLSAVENMDKEKDNTDILLTEKISEKEWADLHKLLSKVIQTISETPSK
ncbi:MAG: MarR family transcriptional regulator [Treponema sp.]|nr:MarR family transcriptional regulator [Treponema sp.]